MIPVLKSWGVAALATCFSRFSALLAIVIAAASPALAQKWPKLDLAELADKTPRVDPEAGAEILLREVELDDAEDEFTAVVYYVRAKIYSERSLEKFSKVEIFYSRDDRIESLSARTHRPDGTVVELARKDVFERDVIKTGDYRQKVKAFAPPGLEVGSILEYRYTRVIYDGISALPLSFQADYPTRLVRFRLRPYTHPRLTGRLMAFSYPHPLPPAGSDGYYEAELRNVPARVDEPWQPPSIQTEPTVLMYYSDRSGEDYARIWSKRAAELFKMSDSETKPGKAVRAAVDGLLAPGDSDDVKLRKIYDYCRSRIKNRGLESSGFTDEQRAKFRGHASPEVTLAAGHGSGRDITAVFVAMARAAGLDARYAWCNDFSAIPFDTSMVERFALPDLLAAVRVGDAWRYLDPARIYLPLGMLSWENTGTGILVAEKTDGKIAITPTAPAEESRRVRSASLKLEADGTLTGSVTMFYTGQWLAEEKNINDGKTPKAIADRVVNSIRDEQPLAEVTDVKVLNATDPLETLRVTFNLRIPEYAERTGSRLFFQPAVFEKGTKSFLEATTRKLDVQLRYRYATEDRIVIELPEDFAFEAPSAPADLDLEKLAHYKVRLGMLQGTRQLQYQRSYTSNFIRVPVKYYGPFKTFFDTIHSRDSHALTLRRIEPKATSASGAPR